MRTMPRPRWTTWKVARRAAAAALGLALLFVGYRWATGNLGVVTEGRVYRSAQLGPGTLSRTIRRYGIKTVLNLRGSNVAQPWYTAERSATLAAGATQVDISIASDYWLSREQARTLVEALETCEKPVLIHCEWGAERTGLGSAMATLLRPGSTTADARRQFSAYYLFLPIRDGLVMRGHLDEYEGWLKRRGLAHTPEVFRRWVAEVYRPQGDSREDWPCEPYPLKTVTRVEGGVVRTADTLSVDRPTCPRVRR
jgi:protein tyrosine phosphatase (PTP) superfamily phosphohydrolase (DUF442 family)